MRVLLDECVDRRFAQELPGHEVRTVPQMGWAGVRNGVLLTLAAAEFDVFITVDRHLSFQQSLAQFDLAVIVLVGASTRLADLRALVPVLLPLLPHAPRRTVTVVGG